MVTVIRHTLVNFHANKCGVDEYERESTPISSFPVSIWLTCHNDEATRTYDRLLAPAPLTYASEGDREGDRTYPNIASYCQ